MSSSPLAPKILKGAFVKFDTAGIVPVPQFITFQYNPESLSRKLKPYEQPADKEGKPQATALNAPYDPEEEFDVAVTFDATDDLEEPGTYPQTVVIGVADRIAALELLMYPVTAPGLLTSAVNAIGGLLGLSSGAAVPTTPQLPIVLFVWGPGRVLPVKVSSFAVEEQAFNSALYPIRAKVTVGIKVLTDQYFTAKLASPTDHLPPAESIAVAAYRYTAAQKKVLSAATAVHGAESLLASLPL